jgi:hypothetical protein
MCQFCHWNTNSWTESTKYYIMWYIKIENNECARVNAERSVSYLIMLNAAERSREMIHNSSTSLERTVSHVCIFFEIVNLWNVVYHKMKMTFGVVQANICFCHRLLVWCWYYDENKRHNIVRWFVSHEIRHF